MKKLLNLKDAKVLNKKEQIAIEGGGYFSCTQQGANTCCQTYPSGFVLCEPGRCHQYPAGRCFWF